MKKILLSIAVLALCTHSTQAMHRRFAQTVYAKFKAINTPQVIHSTGKAINIGLTFATAATVANGLYEAHTFNQKTMIQNKELWPHVPHLHAFCKTLLQESGINPENQAIIIKPDGGLEVCLGALRISQFEAGLLEGILSAYEKNKNFKPDPTKPHLAIYQRALDSQRKELIDSYKVAIRHEIGHIKNHDTTLRMPGAPFIIGGLLYVAEKAGTKALYRRGTIRVPQTVAKAFGFAAVNIIAGGTKMVLTISGMAKNLQSIEKKADEYAFAMTKNPEELNAFADSFEFLHKNLLDGFADKKMHNFTVNYDWINSPKKNLDIKNRNGNQIHIFIPLSMQGIQQHHMLLKSLYKNSKSDTTFSDWIKSNDRALIMPTYDPLHPHPLDRAADARKRAAQLLTKD